ncbi:MAG: hypothetical protein MMC23_004298 [Stictis urceolatum]|nr:hypothetical protein [Stictis urceolata]
MTSKNSPVFIEIVTHAEEGVIIVKNSFTAANPQPGRQPMTFLCLKEHAGDVQKPLKLTYYIAGDVQNDSTIARLVEVLGSGEDQQREASTKAWPGYVLSIAGKESSEEKDDARVILGTPTGLTAGYILVDRQSTFLGKTVTSVAITEAEVNL